MSHTVIINQLVEGSSDINDFKTQFKSAIQLGGRTNRIYPHMICSTIAPDSYETFNLQSTGGTKIRFITVKSSRPVQVVLSNATDTFTAPFTTHFSYCNESKEADIVPFSYITINVPPAPTTQPPGALPLGYPSASVEIYFAAEEQ